MHIKYYVLKIDERKVLSMKRTSTLVTLLLITLIVSACAPAAAPAPDAGGGGAASPAAAPAQGGAQQAAEQPAAAVRPLILRAGNDTVASHPETRFLLRLSELVEEYTEGRVLIEVFPSNMIGTSGERLQGLRDGTVAITSNSVGFFASFDPLVGIFESPYLFISDEHQYRVFQGEVGHQINERLHEHGFFVFAWLEVGARNITNSVRPIYTPEDLNGLLLRVPDTRASIEALTALGAAATPMPFAEVYMALQQGVVDGQENPLANIYNGRLYEVQNYVSLTGHQRLQQSIAIGTIFWDQISPEDQEHFMRAAAEAKVYAQALFREDEERLIDVLRDRGMSINEVDVSLFVPLAQAVHESHIEEFGDVARNFFEIIESLTP